VPNRPDRFVVPLAFLAFVSLGLPDGVLGVAWPSIRRTFDRPIDQLGLILLATMAGYLLSSFSAGPLLSWLGVGRLLVASGLLVALSAAAWAASPWWPPIVGTAFVSGLGAGAIDAGVNAFAAARFTPRVITWLHACWGLGAMSGPLVMTAVVASGAGWRRGYALLAGSLVGLSAAFAATLGLWRLPGFRASPAQGVAGSLREALREPRVRANALPFFLYTGVEASAGQWAYSLLTESRGMSAAAAGLAAATYWGSIFAGRLAFGALAHHVSPALLLRLGMAGAPLAALVVCLTRTGGGAFAGLFALGLLLAPIFPLLIAETPARVGERHAAHAIGFQVGAATLGAGFLPATAGILARGAGLESLGPFLLAATLALLLLHERAGRRRGPRGARAILALF
jgi:fucose permease